LVNKKISGFKIGLCQTSGQLRLTVRFNSQNGWSGCALSSQSQSEFI
jgi:hypothetical protein